MLNEILIFPGDEVRELDGEFFKVTRIEGTNVCGEDASSEFCIDFSEVVEIKRGNEPISSVQLNNMEDAWDLLQKTPLKLGQRVKIRALFMQEHKENYPFVTQKVVSKKDIFLSEIPQISSLGFETKEEVYLVNAMYENTKDNFDLGEFQKSIKYVFRLLELKSVWTQ